ncbi:uncharacterized protein TRUGW13939_04797 [Talaromyces rugulosus]|uniref:Uncharacterized protein n=1 Tax=Talaromyces rugulosus TaxID=121627 RepID=A0A7H8QUM8_TALRU|nr:uncharacterized protein TRUGW13939_04797 [Talaromyces rugulosus]QKX57679.1 hypothetical protein TRUGW13939_04797 [Talaromyces rugulosus]
MDFKQFFHHPSFTLADTSSARAVGVTSLWLIGLAWFTKILYNIYLHPLAKYPGSKLYAASSIPLAIAQLRGRWHLFVQAAHEKYGPVVRLGPSELSYISAPAWNDIYARRGVKAPLPRDRTFFNDMLVDPGSITMADDTNHGRIRRSLAPAFSQKALLEQESIIQGNVDLLLDQLQKRAQQGLASDLRAWNNYATFDLIGDLAFGDTFGCLKTSEFHEWVKMVLDYFYVATLLQVVHRFRPLNRLLVMMLPASLVEEKEKHTRMALEKVRTRTSTTVERSDFIHYMQKAVELGSITNHELENQASILILAGSETTSIALTYAIYFLITHQDTMRKLRAELTRNFQNERDITLITVNQLEYLQAVLQETLRMRPPITNGFPRQTPKEGAIIDGQFVPGTTVVNISHWAAYQSSANFLYPDQFRPERWTGDKQFDGDSKDCFQPFSVGPRNCIGKKFAYDSMKLILARMLWRFDVALEGDVSKGGKNDTWVSGHDSFVSWNVPPLNISLTPRQ